MTAQTPTQTPSRPAGRPAPRAAARTRRPRGEGQWALGYREPLNANEQSKKDDNPLHVRARIENIYVIAASPASTPVTCAVALLVRAVHPAQVGIDGGKTAYLEPHELDDEYFMLRSASTAVR